MKNKEVDCDGYTLLQSEFFKYHSHMIQFLKLPDEIIESAKWEKKAEIAYTEEDLVRLFGLYKEALKNTQSHLEGHTAYVTIQTLKIEAKIEMIEEMLEFLQHKINH